MSVASQFFGGGGAIGLIPVFPPKRLNRGPFTPGNAAGFVGDGDHFTYAGGIAGTFIYRDDLNATIWSLVPTDINASCDAWISWTLDGSDDLLYMVAMDSSTDTVYLASMDIAGPNPVNIGNFTTSTNLSTAGHGWDGNGTRYNSMIRDAEGSGNFNLVLLSLELVISTVGALVSETTLSGIDPGAIKLTDDMYFSVGNSALHWYELSTNYTDKVDESSTAYPAYIGLPTFTDFYAFLGWKGELIIANGSNLVNNSAIYDRTEIDINARQLIKNFRGNL